jgi:type II secretion system protein G
MQKGITLAELVIVLLIIGILAAVILPVITAKTTEARYTQAIADLDAIKTAIASFQSDMGSFPPSDVLFDGCTTLRKALMFGLDTTSLNWKGPYLDMKLQRTDTAGNILDPWGKPYVYVLFSDYTVAPGTEAIYGPDSTNGTYFNPNSYQIYSMGMNLQTDTTGIIPYGKRGSDSDDINNWWGDERTRKR